MSLLAIFSVFILLTGCEKAKPVSKEKTRVEKPKMKEKVLPKATNTETAVEILGAGQEKDATTKDIPATATQKYEGSETLNRYIDDSP